MQVAANVLPDRMLVMVLNRTKAPLSPTLSGDLAAWLPAGTDDFAVEAFDEQGQSKGKSKAKGTFRWTPPTALQPLELSLFEIHN